MKKILVVVDYQKDFVSGSLGFPGAESLAGPIREKIAGYLAERQDVVFTLDTHGPDYADTQEGRKLPVPHCMRGSEGWMLHAGIAEFQAEAVAVFEKPAFGSMELAEFLRDGGYDVVELVGLVSNICVLSNAVLAKAALPEAEVVVDARCTAGGDAALHEKSLDVMEGLQISVVNRRPQTDTTP